MYCFLNWDALTYENHGTFFSWVPKNTQYPVVKHFIHESGAKR